MPEILILFWFVVIYKLATAFLPDGNVITSEKGIVRIKEYKPSGELVGVVAAPSKFEGGELAPDIVTDEQGRVYALDKDRKMIRVFEKK